MHEGRTVFAQLMDWLPKYELAKCVKRYRGDFHVRAMSCQPAMMVTMRMSLSSMARL